MTDIQYVPYCTKLFEDLGREVTSLRSQRVPEPSMPAAVAPQQSDWTVGLQSSQATQWTDTTLQNHRKQCNDPCHDALVTKGISGPAAFFDACKSVNGKVLLSTSDGGYHTDVAQRDEFVTLYSTGANPEARCSHSVVSGTTCDAWNGQLERCNRTLFGMP